MVPTKPLTKRKTMAESKRASAAQPISDVSHPDKTAPSLTSRPLIRRSGPVLQDPMIAGASDEKKSEETAPEQKLAQTAHVKVHPLTDSSPVLSNKPSDDKPVEEAEPEKTDVNDKPTTDETKPEEKTPEKETTQSGDAQGAQKSDAPDLEAEESKRAEHDAAIQKLVDGKQYYLPINSVEKRKSKRFVAVGILLSLLLAVAWADVALDAGLVHIANVKPVTHFFSN